MVYLMVLHKMMLLIVLPAFGVLWLAVLKEALRITFLSIRKLVSKEDFWVGAVGLAFSALFWFVCYCVSLVLYICFMMLIK